MASNYDQINKIKEKYKKEIDSLQSEISSLKEKLTKLEDENNKLRKDLYDVGEGKGAVNRLKKEMHAKDVEYATLKNKMHDIDGSKLINTFSNERKELINKIKALKFENNSIFNSLVFKFKDGLDNVIEIAYRIKHGFVDDMDYFTFVFRDDIVGLLEKMLGAVLNKSESSAAKYLVKLRDDKYSFPKQYYVRIPKLKDKNVINNILYLTNLQTTAYHGTQDNLKHLVRNHETNEKELPDKFLNLNSDAQLEAIFTLLEFMYDVFTNSDHEVNLISVSQNWFKTI